MDVLKSPGSQTVGPSGKAETLSDLKTKLTDLQPVSHEKYALELTIKERRELLQLVELGLLLIAASTKRKA